VRVLNENLDHVSVLCAELTQVQASAEQTVVLKRGDETVKLFLLVAEAVLLHDDGASKVLEQVRAEGLHSLRAAAVGEGAVDALSCVIGLLVVLEVGDDVLSRAISQIADASNELLEFVAGEVGDIAAREVSLVSVAGLSKGASLSCCKLILFTVGDVLSVSLLEISLNSEDVLLYALVCVEVAVDAAELVSGFVAVGNGSLNLTDVVERLIAS
jgi:hypothetical protein